jgi:hypothetical protein
MENALARFEPRRFRRTEPRTVGATPQDAHELGGKRSRIESRFPDSRVVQETSNAFLGFKQGGRFFFRPNGAALSHSTLSPSQITNDLPQHCAYMSGAPHTRRRGWRGYEEALQTSVTYPVCRNADPAETRGRNAADPTGRGTTDLRLERQERARAGVILSLGGIRRSLFLFLPITTNAG